MLKMRYANYPKDYFMGILPSSQYGSVALLPSLTSAAVSPTFVVNKNDVASSYTIVNNNNSTLVSSATNTTGVEQYSQLNTDLSALSLRATEYLQRWKEVVQFSSKDYSDQMAAQFGIKAPEYMGNHAHYIGGGIVTGKQIGRASCRERVSSPV